MRAENNEAITQTRFKFHIVLFQIGSVPEIYDAESKMLQSTSSDIIRRPLDIADGP